MLYREIIAVCSEIHTKHINALCGQNVELLNAKLAVHIVTTGLYRVKDLKNLDNYWSFILSGKYHFSLPGGSLILSPYTFLNYLTTF